MTEAERDSILKDIAQSLKGIDLLVLIAEYYMTGAIMENYPHLMEQLKEAIEALAKPEKEDNRGEKKWEK